MPGLTLGGLALGLFHECARVGAARVADFVLIPVKPQIFDLETLAVVRDTSVEGRAVVCNTNGGF